MVVSGLRAARPSHLTLWRLSSWEMGSRLAAQLWYRPIMRRMQELWKVSSWAAWEPVRANDSAAPYMRRESARQL